MRTQEIECERAQEGQLLVRYYEDDDMVAREELVKRFLPLAHALASRYSRADEPFEDLLQVAYLGLIKAIDRFEPSRGSKLASYAAPTIIGELKRHFRDKGWALHVPRELKERVLAVSREAEALSMTLRRSPRPREIALSLNCPVEAVLEAQEAAAGYDTASLNMRARHEDNDSLELLDLIGEDDPAYELVADRHAMAASWEELPEVERSVLRLRFVDDLTQREIGERVGYSQMHVSRLIRGALERLAQGGGALSPGGPEGAPQPLPGA